MRLRAFLIACLTLLSACTTLPERPTAGRSGEGKVGFWVEMQDSPMHSHASGGLFGSYNRPYPNLSWGLTEYVNSALASQLKSSTKFQLVDLKAAGYSLEDVSGLVSLKDNQFTVTDDGRRKTAKLQEQFGLDFVVVIQPQMTSAISGCTPFGYCESVDGIGMGLFTKNVTFAYEYSGVLGARFTVFSLNPAAILSAYAPTSAPQLMFKLYGFSKPASWKDITEEEWLPVKKEIFGSANYFVEQVVKNILGTDIPTSSYTPKEGTKSNGTSSLAAANVTQ